MTAAAFLILAASLAALATVVGLVAVAVRARLVPGPTLVASTVVIHTQDGRSIRGILVAEHADRLTLREAFYLHESGAQDAGGLVHVPRDNVAFLQELQSTGTAGCPTLDAARGVNDGPDR